MSLPSRLRRPSRRVTRIAVAIAAWALTAALLRALAGPGAAAAAVLALPAGAAVTLGTVAAGHRRAAHRLERANRSLTGLTASVAHDLREPLVALAWTVELLCARARGRLDSEDEELLGFLAQGTDQLRSMVDRALAPAGASLAGRRPVSCAVAAQEALDYLRPVVEERGARVEIGELPLVDGDPLQLRRVFQNLLSNAIKFVPAGRSPRVRVESRRMGGEWRIAVTDNGIGIELRDRDRIFAMQARGERSAGYGGLGIGLASARRIVEEHGGRIWASSPPGGGATLTFTLPVAARDQAIAGAGSISASRLAPVPGPSSSIPRSA